MVPNAAALRLPFGARKFVRLNKLNASKRNSNSTGPPSANRLLADIPEGEVIPLDLFAKLPHALRSIDGALSGMVDTALAAHGLSRNVTLALPHFRQAENDAAARA